MPRILNVTIGVPGGGTGAPSRDDLVAGDDRPTVDNTGVPAGTTLREYGGSYTISAAGIVLDGYIFRNAVRIRAANVTIQNSLFLGPPTDTGAALALVDCANVSCVNALVQDCTFDPTVPTRLMNGFQGGNFTAKRNYLRNVVDYFSIYAGNGTTDPLNVYILQNLGDGMHGESPDSTHSDNVTHNDGVQIQGGSGPCRIVGNDLYAGYYNNGSWTQGSGGLAAPDRGTGDDTNGRYQNNLGFCVIQYTAISGWFPHSSPGALIETLKNWVRGGNRGINAGSANNTDIGRIWGNRLDDDQGIRASLARGGGHTINMDATTTADTGDGTANANVYMSSVPVVGGNEVTVRRNQ